MITFYNVKTQTEKSDTPFVVAHRIISRSNDITDVAEDIIISRNRRPYGFDNVNNHRVRTYERFVLDFFTRTFSSCGP